MLNSTVGLILSWWTSNACSCDPTASCRRSATRPREFAELEHERMWSRVWQIACREEELAGPGDFVEYEIGDETIAIVRDERGDLGAFHNACLHRGTRLAEGCGSFTERRDPVPVPRMALRDSTAGSSTFPTGTSSPACPTTSRCARSASTRWGGFVFVNLDPGAEPLARVPRPAAHAARAVPPRRDAPARRAARRSSTRTGRRSSTRSTRATTCRACTGRSCRGPTT